MRKIKCLSGIWGSFLFYVCATSIAFAQSTAPRIPLVPGLTIVTAIETQYGDYESIKRILSVDEKSILMRYSAQYVAQDALGEIEPSGTLTKTESIRRILRADLERSTFYMQQFAAHLPETIAGTTAIGTSKQVLKDLKRGVKSEITVFQTPIKGFGPNNPMQREAGDVDYRLPGTIERVLPMPTPVRVIVNNKVVDLPTIHAKGELVYEPADFYFLDDETNPLALRFDIQKSKLRVIRINFPITSNLISSSNEEAKSQKSSQKLKAPLETTNTLEKSLAAEGKVDSYGIYFDFSSAVLRPESDLALIDIAQALKKNPTWKLQINGHTDNIGTNNFNLELSRQRAKSVCDALVKRYAIAATRLVTNGFGAAQPKATNANLEGRALNRRVELIRLNHSGDQ